VSTAGHPRVRDYLDHIVQAIERIKRYVAADDHDGFLRDEKTQDAVIRTIGISGEAARNVERVAPEYAAAHPEIPWPVTYAMRNRVSHGYFEIDLDLVWRTVLIDLPVLESQMRTLLSTIDTELARDRE
jgi:uncharacterized protein with HEPN domain